MDLPRPRHNCFYTAMISVYFVCLFSIHIFRRNFRSLRHREFEEINWRSLWRLLSLKVFPWLRKTKFLKTPSITLYSTSQSVFYEVWINKKRVYFLSSFKALSYNFLIFITLKILKQKRMDLKDLNDHQKSILDQVSIKQCLKSFF